MVEAGDAAHRLAHQMAGVEGQDDLVVALAAEFLADEAPGPRRMLPFDGAAVQAGRVVAQGVELAAVAGLVDFLGAEEGSSRGSARWRPGARRGCWGSRAIRGRARWRSGRAVRPSGPGQRSQSRWKRAMPRRRGRSGIMNSDGLAGLIDEPAAGIFDGNESVDVVADVDLAAARRAAHGRADTVTGGPRRHRAAGRIDRDRRGVGAAWPAARRVPAPAGPPAHRRRPAARVPLRRCQAPWRSESRSPAPRRRPSRRPDHLGAGI